MDRRQVRPLALAVALACPAAFAQCASSITDGAQTLCGAKTFTGGAVIGDNSGEYPGLLVKGAGVVLDGPYSFLQTNPTANRSMYLRDSVVPGSTAPSFSLQTRSARLASDEILRITNGDAPVAFLFGDGSWNMPGALRVGTALHSGEWSLTGRSDGYIAIGGGAPLGFWGHHGAVQVGNVRRMVAGFPFEVYNAISDTGAATDHVFMVGYRGTISTQADVRSTNIQKCDGTDVNPDPTQDSNRYPNGCVPNPDGGPINPADGGVCNNWYVATEAGHAQPGEIALWVSDVEDACQCVPRLYDGGLTSGWRKMSDRTECRP